MFEWLVKDKSVSDAENGTEIESNIPPIGLRMETTESAKVISAASSKRREQSDSGKGVDPVATANAASIVEQAKILDALLDPKVWRGAVAAPGDMMVAVTGKKHWELSDDERDTLAKTGAATARCFAVTDPKWLALSLFAFSVISIYGGRMMKDMKDKADEKKNASLKVQNVS